MKKIFFLCVVLYLFNFISCRKDTGTPADQLCKNVNAKYSSGIALVIQTQCATKGCHVYGGTGNGDFTTYAGISAKADPPLGNGALRNRIVNGVQPQMPPSGPLPDSTIQQFKCWLNAGAPNN